MTEELPLFQGLEQALIWAYYIGQHEGGIVKGPSYAQYIKRDERDRGDDVDVATTVHANRVLTGGRPRGLDSAAQAGMIKSCVESLPLAEVLHIKAAMLRADERKHARQALTAIVAPMVDFQERMGLLAELMAKCYGRRDVKVATLAKKYAVDRRKVTSILNAVRVTLDAIGYRAETTAYNKLQAKGVVP